VEELAMRSGVVVVLGLLVSTVLLATAGGAKTLRVPAEYDDLVQAIREATYGDTVLVSPGKYKLQERLRSGVKLLSVEGPDSTILWNQRWYILKLIDCDLETTVSGFTFDGRGANMCIACTTGAPAIIDNVILDAWDGISLYQCNAFIKGNTISGCNRGIQLDYSDPEFLENVFLKNGDAVSMVSSAPVIARCEFTHNSRAVLILGHSYPTIGGSLATANDIMKNGYTIYNGGLRIEGTSYTNEPEVAIASYNYWGGECPEETRYRGDVVFRPWTDAKHDSLFEKCPEPPVAEEKESD
jgi:parallel beta-helix repeat protein